MFAKTSVVGEHAHALFRRLSAAAGAPEWNFDKYLVDPPAVASSRASGRVPSRTRPSS